MAKRFTHSQGPQIGGSLRRRFSLTLVLVVTAILFLFSTVVGWHSYSGKEAELQKQLQKVMKLAETSLPEAVWKLDQRSMNDILRAILANEAVVYARVLVDDKVVARQARSEVIYQPFEEFQSNSEFLISSALILRDGSQVGKMQIVMSKNAIYRELFSTTATVIGLLFLLLFAILTTSMLILRHYIFLPLAALEEYARNIAKGQLETPIGIDSDDEIGRLASTLHIMTRRLQESFEHLEQKVRERTADLSDAKLAAEATSRNLAVIGAELQALLDNSPVGIVFVDNKGMIIKANQELVNITGYRVEDLVGNTGRMLYSTDQAYRDITVKTLPVLKRKGTCVRQTALQRKDGVEILCQLRGRVVPGEGGLEGVVWSVEDITARVRLENELLKTKKQESINILAGGIAHDFNNILFAVIGNISLAERLVEEPGPLRECLAGAHAAANKARDLTAKLLEFARGVEPIKAAVSLPELVKDAAGLVLSVGNHKVQCDFEVPEDLWAVSMDKEQISQVMVALVRNAEQAMPEGGRIRISMANIELGEDQVAGLYPGKYVKINLEDEGSGIADRYLDKIFDPYFSTKEKDSNKGAGLGLAIVHSIINKHEGKIIVDSSQGSGTDITLYLPAVKNGVAEAAVQ